MKTRLQRSDDHTYPPGSHRAQLIGCRCPMIENGYGGGVTGGGLTFSERLYVVDPRCPRHGDDR